ncbi:anti-sigma factor family protein [Mumia sp. Pv 4-285]|uniref:anti-sigma factor family protein n=1 Tax=Mumia qirimensis TaxID=3234852 RepID=UPI00351D4691
MAHLGDRVAAYVDGQLPADESARADTHLATCEECREAVRAQRALKRRMTGLVTTPGPSSSLLSALSDPERLAAAGPPSRLTVIFDHLVIRATIAATGATAVLAGIAYVVGAPHQPVETVTPPVGQLVSQFQGASDPVAQSVRAAARPPAEVSLAAVPAHAAATVDDTTEAEAVTLLERALGSDVSARLLAHRYDLSVDRQRPGLPEVVVASGGHRVASYRIDEETSTLRKVVRYAQHDALDSVVRAIQPVARSASTRTPVARQQGSQQGAERIEPAVMERLVADGWPCHDRLGNTLERVAAHWIDVNGERVIALTYTDGESTLSVYEQHGSLDRGATTGFERVRIGDNDVWVRDGAPTVATWDANDVVYTAVTDGSAERLREAVADLPQHPSGVGPLERVRTGLVRLTTWVTPGSRDS